MINNRFSDRNSNLLKILNGFSVLLGLVIIIIFIRQTIEGYTMESWQVTEWLINYKAGFVRRGLSGQLIFELNRVFNTDAYFLIIAICAISYMSMCFLVIRAAYFKNFPFILLPSAYVLGGPVINDFWVRKDVFLVLCFIGVVYLTRFKGLAAISVINILCSIAVLCHESFGIWAFPALILAHYLCLSPKETVINLKKLAESFLCFLPAICVFLACLYFKGNAIKANVIWTSWLAVQFPYHGGGYTVPPGSIEPLSWDIYKAITHYSYMIFTTSYGIYVPIGLLLAVVAVYLIVITTPLIYQRLNIKESVRANSSVEYSMQMRILSRWLIIQAIVIIPLFIIGIDYGRWMFIGITTSVVLYLFIPLAANERLVGFMVFKESNSGFSIITKLIRLKGKISLIVLNSRYSVITYILAYSFVGVSIMSWDLRTFLLSSPAGSVYQFIKFITFGELYKVFGD